MMSNKRRFLLFVNMIDMKQQGKWSNELFVSLQMTFCSWWFFRNKRMRIKCEKRFREKVNKRLSSLVLILCCSKIFSLKQGKKRQNSKQKFTNVETTCNKNDCSVNKFRSQKNVHRAQWMKNHQVIAGYKKYLISSAA